MRRLFWVSVGVGATIYVLRKASKVNAVAGHLTPGGVSTAVNNLADSLRTLATEFKASMSEHEGALAEALLTDPEPARPARSPRHSAYPAFDEFGFDSDDPDQYF